MRRLFLFVLLAAPLAAGCGGKANIYERQKADAKAGQDCAETPSYSFPFPQDEVLKACRQILESYEYKVNEELSEYGFLYAQSGKEDSLVATRIFITPWNLFGVGVTKYEDKVSLSANVFVKEENAGSIVKISFFREAWDNNGEALKKDKINDTVLYDKFIGDLGKALSPAKSERE